jgi:hypothetical protein
MLMESGSPVETPANEAGWPVGAGVDVVVEVDIGVCVAR